MRTFDELDLYDIQSLLSFIVYGNEGGDCFVTRCVTGNRDIDIDLNELRDEAIHYLALILEKALEK